MLSRRHVPLIVSSPSTFHLEMTTMNLLQTPELLAIIFDHLPHRALAKCARINRIWHNEAVRVLWRGSPYFFGESEHHLVHGMFSSSHDDHQSTTPTCYFLKRLRKANPDRFRKYISLIHHLDLCGPVVDHGAAFEKWDISS